MEDLELNNYIQQARKSGMGDDKIREGLLQAGRSEADITEAFKNTAHVIGAEPKPKWHPTPAQKMIAIVGTILILALALGYAYASYLALKNFEEVTRQAEQAEEAVRALEEKREDDSKEITRAYRNETFGFHIGLPESWNGYTVNHIKEDIYDLTGRTTTNNGVVDSFQIIELHHPMESPDNPRAVMPVMIFTLEQWMHIYNEEWSVGAAPMPPSLLGQNSQWVIALPARYNYDFKPGWEEVDQLVHTIEIFEPRMIQ